MVSIVLQSGSSNPIVWQKLTGMPPFCATHGSSEQSLSYVPECFLCMPCHHVDSSYSNSDSLNRRGFKQKSTRRRLYTHACSAEDAEKTPLLEKAAENVRRLVLSNSWEARHGGFLAAKVRPQVGGICLFLLLKKVSSRPSQCWQLTNCQQRQTTFIIG